MSDYEAVIVSDDPKALRRFAMSIRHDNDGDKAACRKLIERFADLLEAQEKAEPVAYLWGGCLIRAEESWPAHRKEGDPLYREVKLNVQSI